MIKIENLSKAYEMKNIFKGLSITLYDNQIYALVGINGIGKTTFLNSITQPTFRTAGNVFIDSIPNSTFESKYHMFFIPDYKDMFLNLSGNEYLSFIINIYKCDFTATSTEASQITSLLKISEDLDKPLSSYSLGMKQKIYLTGALISGARNLILDEPFNGLDPESCIIVKKLLKDYCYRRHKMILFSIHNLDLVSNFSNTIILIDKNRQLLSLKNTHNITELEDYFFKHCVN